MNKLIKKMSAILLAAVLGAGAPAVAVNAAAAAENTVTEAAATPTPAYADPGVVSTNGIAGWPQIQDISSDTFCVMDADSGTVLAEKSDTKQRFPASVTKVLTCLMALKYGNMDDQVTMTQEAVNFAVSGSANLGTQVGEVFTLRDMLYAMMLKSANDIATQIAIQIGGGSLDHYFEMANQEVQSLGCVNTNIHSACGMPDESHYTCAYDLALISREALKYDDFKTIVGTQQYTVPATNLSPARTVASHHPLLMRPDTFPCVGVIGGKTGYTDAAQHVLATYAVRNGRTVIAIQMYDTDMTAECFGACDLINYGEDNFTNLTLADDGEEVLSGGTVTVPKGTLLTDLDLETETASGGEDQTELKLLFNGYQVGSAVMSASDADNWEDTFNAEKYGPTETPPGEKNSSAEETADLPEAQELTAGSEQTMVCVLLGLIGVGVVAIIITVAVKAAKKKSSGAESGRNDPEDGPRQSAEEKTDGGKPEGTDGEQRAAAKPEGTDGEQRAAAKPEEEAGSRQTVSSDTMDAAAGEKGGTGEPVAADAEQEPAGGWLDESDTDSEDSNEDSDSGGRIRDENQ